MIRTNFVITELEKELNDIKKRKRGKKGSFNFNKRNKNVVIKVE